MNDDKNRDGAANMPPAPNWEKALAYSQLEEHLRTPEDRARFIESLEGSLMTSLGIDRGAADRADLAGVLALFFTGETFAFTDGDGTQYVWDVTRAKEVIAANGVAAQDLDLAAQGVTAERILAQYPGLDTKRAAGADLSEPVIFIGFQGEHLLLDGWHRAYKAATRGIPTIPCHVLSEDEAESLLVSKTPPVMEGGTAA